jgi:hypothetical protein
MATATEFRVTRCEHCARSVVLAYRRIITGERLARSVVTSDWIRCPWNGCDRDQRVLVPLEAGQVVVSAWLGLPVLSREWASPSAAQPGLRRA